MKDFKMAHIVPISHLFETENNQYHMCLAHLVNNTRYAEHFSKCVKAGKYVLMDNGEAEGKQLNFENLFKAYMRIHPKEIVLPDKLFDSKQTIYKSQTFLDEMTKRNLSYKVLAVPQGHNLSEWEECAKVFLSDRRINTIGISKFLNIITEDKYIRFKALEKLEKYIKLYNREDVEVHLLGCEEGPIIVNECHKHFLFVRGCDTAFAYLAAQSNIHISLENVRRPKGIIDFINGKYYANTILEINSFNKLAGVKDNGYSSKWR